MDKAVDLRKEKPENEIAPAVHPFGSLQPFALFEVAQHIQCQELRVSTLHPRQSRLARWCNKKKKNKKHGTPKKHAAAIRCSSLKLETYGTFKSVGYH